MQAAPGVKLLVTSRASLNVEGEQLLPVGGMGVPEGSRTSLAEALESSAVQLFVQAAQRGQPTFRLTDDNLAQVLDDLPAGGGAAVGHRAGRRVAAPAHAGRGGRRA